MIIYFPHSFVLTTERCTCRYGIPVLLNLITDVDYGPCDFIVINDKSLPQTAAHFVHSYGSRLTGEELEAAKNFLRQWPDGFQL
jgi:hypothetical protein